MTSEDLVPLIVSSAMALVLPVIAATALSRQFGVALLAGWIGCGASIIAFVTAFETSTVFGYTLIALALLIIPLAREPAPTSVNPDRSSR